MAVRKRMRPRAPTPTSAAGDVVTPQATPKPHRPPRGPRPTEPVPDPAWIVELRSLSKPPTLAIFASAWLETRKHRTQRGDAQKLRDHVLLRLGNRQLRQLSSEDVCGLIRHIQGKKGISIESAKLAYAVFSDLVGAALEAGLIPQDPRVLPPDIWPSEPPPPRPTFTPAEVLTLTTDERLDPDLRAYNALAFYSGLELRRVCRLRFGNWRSQVQEPIAPFLLSALDHWSSQGFEAVYGRPPTSEDWLVPRRSDVAEPHGEGSAYKAFRRGCVKVGVKTRSPNAITNTFGKGAASSPAEPALDSAEDAHPEARVPGAKGPLD